jgi:hypothetical protein
MLDHAFLPMVLPAYCASGRLNDRMSVDGIAGPSQGATRATASVRKWDGAREPKRGQCQPIRPPLFRDGLLNHRLAFGAVFS